MPERITLEKSFKPHWVWAIAFGSAIGWGSFVLPVEWMEMAGPLGVIIGLWIGAMILSLVGLSMGFLVKAYPVTGGAFTYAYLAFGRKHAFLCGWFLILGYAAIVALNASAFALMIKFLLPQVAKQGFLYSVAGWDVYLMEVVIASSVLVIFAWINIRGADATAQTQFYFCALLIAAAVGVTVGMVAAPDTSFRNMTPLFQPGLPTWTAIGAIVAISPWAYVGFDTVPQAAEEFSFSPGKATFLILAALFVAASHYSIMIVATGLAMPWMELVEHRYLWGTGQAVLGVLGNVGLGALAVALCMGIFTGLIGFYISCSRLMFAMSRAKALPPIFSRLHDKHCTPYASIIFICAICLFAPWFGRSVLLWIVDMSAVGISVAFIYYCAAAFRLFKWSPSHAGSAFCKEVAPVKKLIALLGTLSSIGFLGLLLVPGAPGFLDTPAWIALLCWLALGLVFYLSFGHHYLRTPKQELDKLILGEEVVAVA
ncbi:APC family permease [Allopusillimonas ginsengisoli]|uniref:APC family permease n=1 Tax=Allopusillimonas ginsengisoli TaxID=453575 RepID=UPI00101EEB65|nr:APC family permease [Allopusillimonas ginsengisoli]TEA80068.1 APC family permease [Allopusillimonas ginsengisoli]